jgi:hypothetical protein
VTLMADVLSEDHHLVGSGFIRFLARQFSRIPKRT